MDAHNLSLASRYILSLSYLAGAQQRLFPSLTPSTAHIASSHATAFQRTLPFIPASSPTQHMRIMGLVLLTTGGLLAIPRWMASQRHGLASTLARIGEGLTVGVSAIFLYTHWTFGFDVVVPTVNLGLACVMLWGRGRPEYGVRKGENIE